MKLFMEINPQLFDDCSHDYTEHQNNAEAREQARENKWKALTELASRSKPNGVRSSGTGIISSSSPARTKIASPLRIDEVDPVTEDNQKRLDSLKLQDGADRRDRRPTHDRQNSVGSSRSQRWYKSNLQLSRPPRACTSAHWSEWIVFFRMDAFNEWQNSRGRKMCLSPFLFSRNR